MILKAESFTKGPYLKKCDKTFVPGRIYFEVSEIKRWLLPNSANSFRFDSRSQSLHSVYSAMCSWWPMTSTG